MKLFTDSESTLESISSSKQIERKTLRQTVVDLKERLVDGDVHSFSWLLTQGMMADLMTKEMKIPVNLEDVIMRNTIHLQQPLINKVVTEGTEIRMKNIRKM